MVASQGTRSMKLAVYIVFMFRKQKTMNDGDFRNQSGTSHIRKSVLETLHGHNHRFGADESIFCLSDKHHTILPKMPGYACSAHSSSFIFFLCVCMCINVFPGACTHIHIHLDQRSILVVSPQE